MKRPTTPSELATVFDAYATGALPVDAFDDALWSFLCARVPGDEAAFQDLPLAVQYSSHRQRFA